MTRARARNTKNEDPAAAQREQLERQIQAALRLRRAIGARDKLLDFATLMLPDPTDPDDINKTRFEIAPHHQLIAQALERVRAGTIQRLAISMPPRHGKSEIATRLFPAWCIGANPYWQIILAGATAEFAKEEFGRKIRSYMQTPMYQQVFPGAGLRGGSKAVDALTTMEGGNIKSIGKGGQVVGRGADCLVGSTMVETEVGPMRIDALHDMKDPPLVLAYDHLNRKLCYSRVIASRRIDDRETWRLVTDSGREVVGTADHRVFSRRRGYVRLCDLEPGEQLESIYPGHIEAPGLVSLAGNEVPVLSDAVCPKAVRCEESGWSRPLRHVLREVLLPSSPRNEEQQDVRGVRRSGWAQNWAHALSRLLHVSSSVATREPKTGLWRVRNVVLAAIDKARVLLEAVCGFRTFKAHGWPWEPSLQGWLVIRGVVPAHEADSAGEGPEFLRCLRRGSRADRGQSRGDAQQPAYPSCGREPAEQQGGKPGCSLQKLPHHASQEDSVRLVERVCGERVSVYDIQVEGFSNFFANEVLVHNCFIVDDPYSGREEAMSTTERRKVWEWFTADVISRMMPGGRIVVIHQRWHEDDLIGRLTDPNHPEHNPRTAGRWTHLYLPAIIYDQALADALGVDLEVPEDPEHRFMFGDKPMRALWPQRYGLDFFAEIKAQDGRAFEALYMGNPVPDDGEFFRREHIVAHMYGPNELPRNLRYYMASDHAVSTAQERDATCFIVAGVDEFDTLWVVDVWWQRKETDDVVDAAIDLIKRWKPLTWWAEKGHISKSIGPFLRKRMHEENAHAHLVEVTPAKDKMTRAQAIQARMSMGKVRFPHFAPWMQAALDEMLKFPMGRHDDFVDALAHLGGGLARQVGASAVKMPVRQGPRVGTLAWVKESSRRVQRQLEAQRKGGF